MTDTTSEDAAIEPEADVVGDDVHKTVADVRSLVADALAPLKALAASPYRLLSTADLPAMFAAFSAAAHVLVNHVEGVEQPLAADTPEPRDELADSKANNPIEQAQLTAALNPAINIPEPMDGSVQVSPVIEVTAPQSLLTPVVSIPVPVLPVEAAEPTVGQDISDAVVTTDQVQTEPELKAIPIVPQPVETDPNTSAIDQATLAQNTAAIEATAAKDPAMAEDVALAGGAEVVAAAEANPVETA